MHESAPLPLIVHLAYLAASVLFILGLKRLSSPATARSGNQLAAVGMMVAVIATLGTPDLSHIRLILVALVVGCALGAVAARRVAMTDMPQMVALLNGLGGGKYFNIQVQVVESGTFISEAISGKYPLHLLGGGADYPSFRPQSDSRGLRGRWQWGRRPES